MVVGWALRLGSWTHAGCSRVRLNSTPYMNAFASDPIQVLFFCMIISS